MEQRGREKAGNRQIVRLFLWKTKGESGVGEPIDEDLLDCQYI